MCQGKLFRSVTMSDFPQVINIDRRFFWDLGLTRWRFRQRRWNGHVFDLRRQVPSQSFDKLPRGGIVTET